MRFFLRGDSQCTGNTMSGGRAGPNAPEVSGLLFATSPAASVSTAGFSPLLAPATDFGSVCEPVSFFAALGSLGWPGVAVCGGGATVKSPTRVPGGRMICETAGEGLTPTITSSDGFVDSGAPSGTPATRVMGVGLAAENDGKRRCG